MPRATRSNVPTEPLRWSLDAASREFNFSAQTLRAALNKNSAVPGEDSCFSTLQLVESLYGALHLERIRSQREVTEKLRIQNMISRGELLSSRELQKGFTAIADAISARVMSCSELPRTAREDILRDLSSWPLVVVETAHAQSRSRNGKRPKPEGDENESE
jgi:hypothetical protein